MGSAIPGLAAFVLAGGKSTRMGTEKAFVEFEGCTLLDRALKLARSVSDDVRVVGSAKKFKAYAPVVEDIFVECGPLGGIHSALRNSTAEFNLVLAVDMPFLSTHFLRYLTEEARRCASMVTIPCSASRLQPLCAVYRRSFADVAETALRAEQNKIDTLFANVETRIVREEELESAGFSNELFRNLNTVAELKEAHLTTSTIVSTR